MYPILLHFMRWYLPDQNAASASYRTFAQVLMLVLSLTTSSHAATSAFARSTSDTEDHQQNLSLLLDYLKNQYSGIKALEQDRQIAQEGISSAQSSLDPTINLRLTVQHKSSAMDQTTDTASTNDTSHNHDGSASLILSKRILDWGRQDNEVAVARLNLRLTELSINQQRERTYLDAIKAYYATLRSIARRNIREQNLERLHTRVKEAEQRLSAGIGTSLDLASAEASLAQGLSNLSLEEAGYQATLNSLRVYAPEGFEAFLPQQTALPMPPMNILSLSLETAMEEQERYSHNFALARQQISVAEAQFVTAGDAEKPTLDANVNLSHVRGFGDTQSINTIGQASLDFSIPLLDRRSTQSSVNVARQTTDKSRLQYRATHDQQTSLLQKAWYEMAAFVEAVTAARQNLEARQELLSRAEQARQVGQISLINLLDQQDALLEARIDLIERHYQLLISTYDLADLIGLPLRENL